jgi:hypothetical protein
MAEDSFSGSLSRSALRRRNLPSHRGRGRLENRNDMVPPSLALRRLGLVFLPPGPPRARARRLEDCRQAKLRDAKCCVDQEVADYDRTKHITHKFFLLL